MRTLLLACLLLAGAALAHAAEPTTFTKRADVALPGATGFDLVSLDAERHHVLVAHSTRVEILDADKGDRVASVDGLEGAHQAVVVPGTKLGFVSEGKRGKVAAFDAETGKVGKEIEVGSGPDAVLYVESAKEVWVMNHKGGTVSCLDPVGQTVSATIDVGGALELGAELPAKGLVFVNAEDKDSVAVIDVKKHAVLTRYPVAPGTGPTGIAVDAASGVVFCGCDEKIVMLDATNGAVITSLPIGKHCDSVAFDPEARLAFASCADGTTAVVHEGADRTFEVATTIQTAAGGKTCVWDPRSHLLWVAAGTRGKDDLHVLSFGRAAKGN